MFTNSVELPETFTLKHPIVYFYVFRIYMGFDRMPVHVKVIHFSSLTGIMTAYKVLQYFWPLGCLLNPCMNRKVCIGGNFSLNLSIPSKEIYILIFD